MKHLARILYFVAGVAPSAEDFEAAEKLGANVSFRNANAVPAEGALEICDGVAGEVPERYAEAYPEAKEAIAKKKKAHAEAAAKLGETPAPTAAQQGFGGNGTNGTPDPTKNAPPDANAAAGGATKVWGADKAPAAKK